MAYRQTTNPEKLYRLLVQRGYPEDFCAAVCRYMNTDYTAGRMLGYLSHFSSSLPPAEIADELIAILSERERFIEKAKSEKAQAAYTAYLNRPREEDEE